MNRYTETNVWPDARKFAEQHQVDPDEAYRDAIYAEIQDALIWLGFGAVAALLLVAIVYFGGIELIGLVK